MRVTAGCTLLGESPGRWVLLALVALAAVLWPATAAFASAFPNLGFEDGLTHWSSVDVTVREGPETISAWCYPGVDNWTVEPYAVGNRMARLEPKNTIMGETGGGGHASAWDQLGLSQASRDYLNRIFQSSTTDYAIVYRDLALLEGDTFSMAWNYVATDYDPFNDGSFVTLVNTTDPSAPWPLINGLVGDLQSLGVTMHTDPPSGTYVTGDCGTTGWQTTTFEVRASGTYRLGFAAFNLSDTLWPPIVFVDEVAGITRADEEVFDPIAPSTNPPPPQILPDALVTTGAVSDVTATSASVAGAVTDIGTGPLTQHGHVWSTATNPTVNLATKTELGGLAAPASFSSTLSGLEPDTTYYVRAYATNAYGTSYSTTVATFTTVLHVAPTVTATTPATEITSSSAMSGGSITADGGSAVTERGLVWNTVGSPTLESHLGSTTAGAGTGVFSAQLSGLVPATSYYVRAYATNGVGTSYAPQVSFTTDVGRGEIKTTDYGTTPTSGGAYYWRGYSFQVRETTTVTHLIGGGQTATTSGFQGAIFDANTDASGNATSPRSILGLVNFTGNTPDQVVALASAMTLQPDTWYYLAQGDTGGSPRVYHWYVASLDALDLVAASYRLTQWRPSSAAPGQAHYWTVGDPQNAVVGRAPSTTNDKPAVGFRYLTDATLPAVTTLTTPMYGEVTNRGNARTALYIEYGTSPGLTSGTTLNLSEAAYEGPVPYDFGTTAFGLTSNTTYYYRARAINDAGRVEGVIRSFTTPSPPGAPTITDVTPDGDQLSVHIEPPDESFDTYQYSLDDGATWISRSPASSASPLVITGLTIGATYQVVVRAVAQGIVGAASNLVTVTLQQDQTITFATGDWQSRTYGDAPFTLLATASSGLPVTFSSSDDAVVTIAGTTATITGAGEATITATQGGDTAYFPAEPVQRVLNVAPSAITVRADDAWKAFDEDDPDLTFTVTSGALRYDDTLDDVFTGTLERAGGTSLGTYPIERGSLTANANYSLTFDAGTLFIHHAAPDHLRTLAPPGPQVAGEAFVLVSITAFDRYGHVADGANGATAYAGAKTLSYTLSADSDGPSGDLDTFTTAATFDDGVATTTLVTVLHRAQTTTISANDATLPNEEPDVSSAPFEVVHATAAHLVFDTQPSTTRTAVPFAVAPSVLVHDAYGNLVTGFVDVVAFELLGATASLEPSGGVAIPAASGVATLPCSWVDAPALGVRLHTTSAGLTSATSTSFDVTGALVSGVVYVDVAASGNRGPEAPGIAGARVALSDEHGTLSWPDGGELSGAVCTAREIDETTTDAQGRYRLPGLDAGSYTLAVSGGALAGMVRVGRDPFTITAPAFGRYDGVDVGFFPGAFIEGALYRDDGAGDAGVAADAVRQAGEPGLVSVTLHAAVGANAPVSTISGTDGAYRLALPLAAGAPQAVSVTHAQARATGHWLMAAGDETVTLRAGSSGDVAAFLAAAGETYRLEFGVLPPLRLLGAGEAASASPGVARYTVTVQPGTLGPITLIGEPNRYAWTPRLHPDDAHCAGLTLAADGHSAWQLSGAWPRQPGDERLRACRVQVDVHVPAGEPTGRVDDLILRAHLAWSRPAEAPPVNEASAPLVLRTTVVEGGRVALAFAASSDGGLSYGERVEAPPGSPVQYRVRFTNPGAQAVHEVVVRLPIADAYTVPLGASDLPAMLTCPGALAAVSVSLPYDSLTRSLSLDLAAAATCGLDQLPPGAAGELTLTLEIR